MVEELVEVEARLVRKALSIVYISIGFFMVLAWLWESEVGLTAVAITYLATASVIFPHVFKPLIRFSRYSALLGTKWVATVKVFGFVASAFGVAALLATALGPCIVGAGQAAPILGLAATSVAIITLFIAALMPAHLFGFPEAGAVTVFAATVVTYAVRPSFALPTFGAAFMCLGALTYWLYYVKPGSRR